jgi:hypothetical protein
MTPFKTSRWLLLLAYPVPGLALGLADPWLGQMAQSLGFKPGVATAVSVNLLLPLAAAILGFCHARVAIACVGSVVMTAGLIAGLAVRYAAAGQAWSLADLVRSVPPVLVFATIGYAVIGTLAALAGQSFSPFRAGPAITPD